MRLSYVILVTAAGLGAFAPPAAAAAAWDNGICIVAGPYENEGMAKQLTATLRSDGLTGQATRRPTPAAFYRVALEGFPNLGEADEAASRLRSHGLDDLLVHRSAANDGEPWISLGLFRELNNAVRRSEEAQLLGFDPKIDTEYLSVPRWYVGVAASANAAALAVAVETAPRLADCMASRSASSQKTIASGGPDGKASQKIAQADVPPNG